METKDKVLNHLELNNKTFEPLQNIQSANSATADTLDAMPGTMPDAMLDNQSFVANRLFLQAASTILLSDAMQLMKTLSLLDFFLRQSVPASGVNHSREQVNISKEQVNLSREEALSLEESFRKLQEVSDHLFNLADLFYANVKSSSKSVTV